MWRPRDHESFIGGYDPEHEMPDPDRDPGDRWQSGMYRHNARDTRIPYRWDSDRFENRFQDRDRGRSENDLRWNRDARDDRDRGYRAYGNEYDRGSYMRGPDFDRDRPWDSDRGFDRGQDEWRSREYGRPSGGGYPQNDYGRPSGGGYPQNDYGRWGSDYDRAREFGGRGYERDWRDRQRFDRGYADEYDRWRNRR